MMVGFVRPAGINPIITPAPASVFDCPMRHRVVHWEALHTFNPAAVVRAGKVYLLYRAEDDTGSGIGGHTSRLGLAESDDGLHFRREAVPVLYPADDSQRPNEWEGGCEDPRVVEAEGGHYVLTYTQWNRHVARLAVATSDDLHRWSKHGPAFARCAEPRLRDRWSKSGAIVCRLQNGRLKAAHIHGHYWMYWGEGDVYAARSDDLLDWRPVVDSRGALVPMLERRPGHFDSLLAEGGPPAVITRRGILVLYNGKNAGKNGDQNLSPDAYAGGQALFDPENPTHLLARTDGPFFKPREPFERTGQYAAGTTFLEGLAYFHSRWFLYYGCADSRVGVAVCDWGQNAHAETFSDASASFQLDWR